MTDVHSDQRMIARNALHDLIMQTAIKDCLCKFYDKGICTRCAALQLANEAFPVHVFRVMSVLVAPDCLVNGKELEWDSTSTTTNQ